MICRIIGIAVIWTEDITMYSFIWSVFLGASAMIYPERHFAFTSLNEHIKSPLSKAILHLCIMCLMFIFMVLLLKYGIFITRKFWNYRCTALPQLKRGWTWLCLPVSGACGCIYLLQKIAADIKKICKGGTN